MSRHLIAVAALAVAGATPATAGAQSRALRDTIAAYETRTHKDSTDAEVYFRLGNAYWWAHRLDDAEHAWQRVTSVDPRYAPAYLALSYLPFDRRPKLWEESRKGRVPQTWQAPLDQSRRLQRQAFLINPFADLRVLGAEEPPEGVFIVPEYGQATTDYLLDLGVSAFSVARYQLSYDAFRKYVDRAYAGKPRDSMPDSSSGSAGSARRT